MKRMAQKNQKHTVNLRGQPSFILAVASVSFWLVACSSPLQTPKVYIWHSKASHPLPPSQVISDSSFSTIQRQSRALEYTVQFSEQKIGPALVEGGFLYRKTKSSSGQDEFLKLQDALHLDAGALDQAKRKSLEKEAEKLYRERGLFYQKLKAKFSELETIELMDDLQVVYLPGSDRFIYRLTYLPLENPVAILRCDFSLQAVRLYCGQASLQFQAPAWVYTFQSLSALQEVLLAEISLVRGNAIAGSKLVSRSQAPIELDAKQLPLRYAKEDPRFDVVQVYHWIQKGLDWTKRYQVAIPTAIEVETSVGYPQNTNAALSYQNQIRLGRGDGITYRNLSEDPSIILHEFGHVLAHFLAFLPTTGEGGSINEGIADYIAASLTGSPRLGEKSYLKGPYRRFIGELKKWTDKEGKLYADSLIVSSFLWELEKLWGAHKTHQFLFQVLSNLGPAQSLMEWNEALKRTATELPEEQRRNLTLLANKSEWPGW